MKRVCVFYYTAWYFLKSLSLSHSHKTVFLSLLNSKGSVPTLSVNIFHETQVLGNKTICSSPGLFFFFFFKDFTF